MLRKNEDWEEKGLTKGEKIRYSNKNAERAFSDEKRRERREENKT